VTILFLTIALVSCVFAPGCGMETDEANEALAAANKHQAEAEAAMVSLANFPAEWQAMFNVPEVGPDQLTAARQLIQAREQDLEQTERELKASSEELNKILSLNVKEKIKEFVRRKMDSVKCWTDYAESYLMPLVKGYSGIVEEIAYARPQAEINQKMAEMAELVRESATVMEECKSVGEQADEYFKEHDLGK
jgi:hypothetical protein